MGRYVYKDPIERLPSGGLVYLYEDDNKRVRRVLIENNQPPRFIDPVPKEESDPVVAFGVLGGLIGALASGGVGLLLGGTLGAMLGYIHKED